MYTVEDIAREIISVQPMDRAGAAFMEILQAAKSEEELIAEGYEPVDPQTRLMWIKPE
jgi:hypothetical protein